MSELLAELIDGSSSDWYSLSGDRQLELMLKVCDFLLCVGNSKTYGGR